MQSCVLLVVATGALAATIIRQLRRRCGRPPLPPSPPGLPLLGNLLQLPTEHLATHFRALCRQYGGFVTLKIGPLHLLLIGDGTLAKALLERRSAKYSSRPTFPYFEHLDPDNRYWGMRPMDAVHSLGRRLTQEYLGQVRNGNTEPLQELDTLLTMQHLLDSGGDGWTDEIFRASMSTVLTTVFGLSCPTGQEPFAVELKELLALFVQHAKPTSSIVNLLPFLDRIPGPMPWRTRARAYREREDRLYAHFVKEALHGKGAGMNNWAKLFADPDKPEGDQTRFLNQIVGAAVETDATCLQSFVLGCIAHPEWIADAQAQVDEVVGSGRLPSFRDREGLPIVEAAVRETLRWRPPARFGLPHHTTSSDIVTYNNQDYFVPANTTVFFVAYAIEHDPTRYEDPDRFEPRRWIDEKGKLKTGYETSTFGYGRRACPGAPFAERTMWIMIAQLLWLFDIRPVEGFTYKTDDSAFNGDLTSGPKPFPVHFLPRNQERAQVAVSQWENCEKDLNVVFAEPKRSS